ncbi:MAG: response regulator [Myxococcaceae bacterium]|jgi:signal transduction histidine kinase/CheY-like chemotaxis protein|nr:response regulator [Myxococcaceae bacterium]MCA3014723.1 response regulator [Myxococcaceae bacterium]
MRGVWISAVGGALLIWAASHLGSGASLGAALIVVGAVATSLVRAERRRGRQADERARVTASLEAERAALTERLRGLETELAAERGRVEVWKSSAAGLEQALEDARESRSTFLATVSHELRTPLHAVIGFTELVSDGSAGPVNPTQAEYLADARAAAHHLMSLVSDVLDFSKADAGQLSFDRERVQVGLLVSEVTALLGGLAHRKDLELRVDCEAGLALLGDALRVKQVLVNLVGNAVKFTPRRGRVEVVAKRDGEWCRLEVRDTGAGIPPAQREAVFEPFRQADSSTARYHGGTGLGLALVKRWSASMGGSVELDPSVEAGSCFVVRMPLAPASGAVTPLGASAPRIDVVVAEDDDATRLMLARVLEAHGMVVRQAANGQRALEAIMAQAPQVLLLDLLMPELDGFEVLDKLRSLAAGAHMPVLVFSATSPEGADLVRLREAKAQIFVKGTLSPTEIAARVRRAVEAAGKSAEPLRSAA